MKVDSENLLCYHIFMNINKWLLKNTCCLDGKTVAISGATGGIGCALCDYLARLGARLFLLDRNAEKSKNLIQKLQKRYPQLCAEHITLDLENMEDVICVTEKLKQIPLDSLILNAGAYHIPRHKCSTGFNNVFQINFISPYYMARELKPILQERGGRVVIVGSIAHNYSHTDSADIDFSSKTASSKVYGNSKRYLMFALYGLFEGEKGLAVTHPGITFTNITAHYPKFIFAIIKHPMKVLFMPTKVACLSILRGVFEDCNKNEWIGPRFFNIWGKPKKQRLTTCSKQEAAQISLTATDIFNKCKNLIHR